MNAPTLAQRVYAIELRMERNSTMLEEIHGVVVGDVSHRPLLERMATAETNVTQLQKQVPTWKQRAMQTAISTAIAAVAGYFGVHLPGPGGGPL